MKRLIACFCILWWAALLPSSLFSQIILVENGRPLSRIVLTQPTETDREAARLLQDFVQRISGATLPIVREKNGKPATGDIRIGSARAAEAGEDGFLLSTPSEGRLEIRGGPGKGVIYGVVTLLEDYLGVAYYAKDAYTLTPASTLKLPALYRQETPAFKYRQTWSYGLEDPIYKQWFRLEEPSEVFAGNLWVHTFDKLIPSDLYGKEHPEYYAFITGQRRPGGASQWCLSNPDVFELAAHKIDSVFKANPGKQMISVSQNDGHNTYCTCPDCRAIDAYEESQAGSLIHFLNKLAARFPDKQFSTLAYLYSVKPPKHVKPLPNVHIMLCDIDCKREVPLTDNASGQAFVRALEGWSAITDQLFVWDYGINFDNIVSPFPNFHILQKNIQLFHKNHVTMHFSQVNGIKGGDFSELRAYMLAKLMWNPYLDADSLMQTFLKGYYGEAARYLYAYQKIMQGALLASGQPLWIYDSPISHKDGMLNATLLKTYNELFDAAEAAVQTDTTRLKRVRLSRLPLQYAELEIARTQKGGDAEAARHALSLFEERTDAYGVRTLNEQRNTPQAYCALYKKRFLPRDSANLAAGATVRWLTAPSDTYRKLGETALTDELFGGTTFVESWVGWEGSDGAFILDLGKKKRFSHIETDFLQKLGAWVLLPKKVAYTVSDDGETFRPFGSYTFQEDRDPEVKFVAGKAVSEQPVEARYIRVEIEGIKTCPPWHYGVGQPAWFFIDEVTVL